MPYISDYKPLFPETGLFERSITTSVYKNILQNYEDNSEDLQYIEDIIEILQYYIFEGKNEIVDEDEYSDDEIFSNKKQAALLVMNIATASIKNNDILYMDYLAIMAQNSVIVGDWNRAISYYFELLNEDGVLNADYDESYYTGELELAAKIIHNICVLYFVGLKSDEFIRIKRQYDYIFNLESQRTKRLIRNNPNLKEGFEDDLNILCDFTEGILYYDSTHSTDFISGNMMGAICSDSERSGKKHMVDLSQTVRIVDDGVDLYVLETFFALKDAVITRILAEFPFNDCQNDTSDLIENTKQSNVLDVSSSLVSADNLLGELENLTGLREVKNSVKKRACLNFQFPDILCFLAILARAKQRLPDCWRRFIMSWVFFLKVS